jgi:hypothetical protein
MLTFSGVGILTDVAIDGVERSDGTVTDEPTTGVTSLE